jgi:MFS family permease
MSRVLLAIFVSWTGLRMTEVALPLIALEQTGSLWATGLVAGSAGISLLTSPWWAARLRHRLTSGRALAGVLVVQALGHLIVAVAAVFDVLSVAYLCVSGLLVGAATSVGGPATRAFLADLGDRFGPRVAVRALAWQDLAHRCSMITSPPIAAWVITQHGPMPLMFADAIAVLLAAALIFPVAGFAHRHVTVSRRPRRARDVLRAHPVVADGIAMAAVGWFWWFAFALGLAILGAETGRPGQLVAAGMAGYGIGSLAGSVTASVAIVRLPRTPLMVSSWIVLGGMFASLPWLDGSLLALSVCSAVGGVAAALGITALNALITEHTSGADRRTAFAVQQVAGTGGSSLGMLSGGAVIAVLGAEATMHIAGLVLVAVPLLLVARGRSRRTRGGAVEGDDLRLGHGLDGEGDALAADARVLAAAEGHGIDPEVAGVVDHDGPDAQRLGNVESSVEVAGEHAGLETEGQTVDHLDRVCDVVER